MLYKFRIALLPRRLSIQLRPLRDKWSRSEMTYYPTVQFQLITTSGVSNKDNRWQIPGALEDDNDNTDDDGN